MSATNEVSEPKKAERSENLNSWRWRQSRSNRSAKEQGIFCIFQCKTGLGGANAAGLFEISSWSQLVRQASSPFPVIPQNRRKKCENRRFKPQHQTLISSKQAQGAQAHQISASPFARVPCGCSRRLVPGPPVFGVISALAPAHEQANIRWILVATRPHLPSGGRTHS